MTVVLNEIRKGDLTGSQSAIRDLYAHLNRILDSSHDQPDVLELAAESMMIVGVHVSRAELSREGIALMEASAELYARIVSASTTFNAPRLLLKLAFANYNLASLCGISEFKAVTAQALHTALVALDQYHRVLPESDESLGLYASTLSNLATLTAQQGDAKSATDLYTQALSKAAKIRCEVLGSGMRTRDLAELIRNARKDCERLLH